MVLVSLMTWATPVTVKMDSLVIIVKPLIIASQKIYADPMENVLTKKIHILAYANTIVSHIVTVPKSIKYKGHVIWLEKAVHQIPAE